MIEVRDLLAVFDKSTAGRAAGAPLTSVEVAPSTPTKESRRDLGMSIPVPARTTKAERVKFSLSQDDKDLINSMPKKQAIKLKRLLETNMDKRAHVELAKGRNPFPRKGAGFLFVATELLLRGGFTRSTLRAGYMQILAWGEGTAFSHVSAAIALLVAMKVAEERGGYFALHPSIVRENEN